MCLDLKLSIRLKLAHELVKSNNNKWDRGKKGKIQEMSKRKIKSVIDYTSKWKANNNDEWNMLSQKSLWTFCRRKLSIFFSNQWNFPAEGKFSRMVESSTSMSTNETNFWLSKINLNVFCRTAYKLALLRDSFSFSHFLHSPFFAIFRPLSCLFQHSFEYTYRWLYSFQLKLIISHRWIELHRFCCIFFVCLFHI